MDDIDAVLTFVSEDDYILPVKLKEIQDKLANNRD